MNNAATSINRKQTLQLWKNLQSPKPSWEEFKHMLFANGNDPVAAIVNWRSKNKASWIDRRIVTEKVTIVAEETWLVTVDGVPVEEDACQGNCAERMMVEKEMNPAANVDIISTVDAVSFRDKPII